MASAPTGLHATSRLLSYLARVLPDVLFREFRAKLIELAPSTEAASVNYYDTVIEEGRAQGVLEGLRAVLAKQLRLKFGALEPAVVQRIERASTDEVDLWLERVLVADDVAGVIDR